MRYLQRSIKYFLTLCVIYFAVMYLMSFATNVVFTPGDKFHAIISTPRGVFLIVAVFVLSAVYPMFGYMRRFIDGDLVGNREQIMLSFRQQGMVLDHESQGRMTFVAGSFVKRVMMLFEDHVKIVQHADGKLAVSGNRKAVAYVIYRLEYAIQNAHTEEQRAQAEVGGR
ncbi:MAG: hypothetical protein R3Y68_00715 [Rikenellaceae bacterium]